MKKDLQAMGVDLGSAVRTAEDGGLWNKMNSSFCIINNLCLIKDIGNNSPDAILNWQQPPFNISKQ